MYTILLKLAKRHFQSEGFKNRLNHIYIPFLKMKLAWVWNIYFNHKEVKVFSEIYKNSTPVLDEMSNIGASPVIGSATLPNYESIANRLKQWFIQSESQGNTSQCVAFTMTNIHRFVARLLGLGEMKVSQLDMYIDRYHQFAGEESGMSPVANYESVGKKGVSIGDTLPLVNNQSLMASVDDRKFFPDAKIAPFRIKMIKGYEQVNKSWGNVVSVINSVPMGYPLQAVLGATDTYFASDVVYGKYNVFYAGHSVTVIGGSACIVDGQEGFFISDSAYFTGKVYRFGTAIRFITKDFWNTLGYSVFKPIFIDSIQEQVNAVKIVPASKSVFVYNTANFGQSNEDVITVQKALLALGYSLPAGATGFYGQQTADAVLKFQLDNQKEFQKIKPEYTVDFFKSLKGKSFGNDSIKVINTLQGL